MENLVSPLIKTEKAVIEEKPLYDDPYGYVTEMDSLTHHDFYYINKKIQHGWITPRDIELVRFLFVHRWLSLLQIGRLFFPDVSGNLELIVKKRLLKLMKYGLLRRIQWRSYASPGKNRPSFYELGASGVDILKYHYGVIPGQRDPRIARPTTMMFRYKYIATNEFYIQLREAFNLVHFEFHPVLKYKEEVQVPTAKYILRNPKGRDITFYLICHREEEKWLKTIRYQGKFFKDYIQNVESATLVVLVSDDSKADLAGKIIEQEGAGQHTWYVTDKDLFNPEIKLTRGFFAYHEGKKVYYDLQ